MFFHVGKCWISIYFLTPYPEPIFRCTSSTYQLVGQSVSHTFKFPLCLCHYRASVDKGTWYIFWKLWPTAFRLRFPKCIFPKCTFLKCSFAKCTRNLLCFESLFKVVLLCYCMKQFSKVYMNTHIFMESSSNI